MGVSGRSASEWGAIGSATVMVLIFFIDTLFRMSVASPLGTAVERLQMSRICSLRSARIVLFTDFLKTCKVSWALSYLLIIFQLTFFYFYFVSLWPN